MGNSQAQSTSITTSDAIQFISECNELKEIDFSLVLKEVEDELKSISAVSDIKDDEVEETLDCVPPENLISDIWDLFEFEKHLGKGGSCTVKLVTKLNEDGSKTHYALKALEKKNNNRHLFIQEVNTMKKLQENSIHANVVKFVDCYIDDDSYYILLEYGNGGTMLQRVLSSSYFCERTAAKWIKSILDGVHFLHSLNIVHRDLKADNYIFDSKEENANLKIIDFGNSHTIEDDEDDYMIIGGKHYFPPEAFRRKKGWELRKGDLWTIGICTYILLCGKYPFHGVTTDVMNKKIRKGIFTWPKKVHLSDTCKDFIQHLLCVDVKQRFSASEALQHSWITGSASDKHLGKDYMHRLKLFAESNRLQQILVTGMLNSMDILELRDLPSILKEISLQMSRPIDFSDVIHYMLVNSDLKKIDDCGTLNCDMSFASVEFDDLLDEIDHDEEMKTQDVSPVKKVKVTMKKIKTEKLQLFEERVSTPKIRVETLERILRETKSENTVNNIVLSLNPTVSNKIEISKIHTFPDNKY